MPLAQGSYSYRGRFSLLGAAVLLASAAFAQEATSASVPQLSADTNIINLRYQCAEGEGGLCSASVSKAEFDSLVQALDPHMSIPNRQALAAEYSRLLIMAIEARRRNIDQSPELQTLLQFSKMQLLAMRLVRDINTNPASVSADEVELYFRDHRRDYREVTLSRIFLPTQPKSTGRPALPALEQAWAVRKRAVAGEDFDALQREISGEPNVRMTPVQCRFLPEAHRSVCDLQPGKISDPVADALGYSIFRLESRRDLKLDEVRQEIRAMLERQQVDGEIQKVRTPVTLQLDERYFGKLPSADLASKHGLHIPATNVGQSTPAPQHKH